MAFHKLAIHYFLELGNFDAAKSRLDIMNELAPEHPDAQDVSKTYINYLTKSALDQIEKMRKGAIEVIANRKITRKQTKKAPSFENKEIEYLYQHGLRIDPLLLDTILKLPRKSLIRDLENVLIDGIARYNYFRRIEDKGDYSEETFSFPIHALFLLAEVRSEQSLDLVLEFCSQSIEFLDFWLDSHITESLPGIFYFIGANQLDRLKGFVKQPRIYTYVRTAVSTSVSQIVFHHSSRRQEVMEWYKDVFNFFISANLKDQVICSDTISLMVNDTVEIRLAELLPLVEELYHKGYVLEDIADSLEETKERFNAPFDDTYKRLFLNIYDGYADITTTWGFYIDENEDYHNPFINDDYGYAPTKPQLNPFKSIGRNDPCPCGSGKKFKKCCGKDQM
ncbi:MAG: DUF1186 domain-containing protein [Tenuifilaceae bacterium]|nr:DUF1186 domain-containing protein [Tenuifilaceae bacterium]